MHVSTCTSGASLLHHSAEVMRIAMPAAQAPTQPCLLGPCLDRRRRRIRTRSSGRRRLPLLLQRRWQGWAGCGVRGRAQRRRSCASRWGWGPSVPLHFSLFIFDLEKQPEKLDTNVVCHALMAAQSLCVAVLHRSKRWPMRCWRRAAAALRFSAPPQTCMRPPRRWRRTTLLLSRSAVGVDCSACSAFMPFQCWGPCVR